MAKSNNKINLIYIPIIYVVYALLSTGLVYRFGYDKYWDIVVELLVNTTLILQMSVISILIAGGLYLFDKKSNFYKLFPLVFVGVVTIKLLMDLM